MTEFFRFPNTPHLLWLGEGQPRDDKILSNAEVAALLRDKVLIEEKLDGANLGISLDEQGELRAQNRGQYLPQPFSGQFSRLNSWLGQHGENLRQTLTPELILFGEWCAARHSLDYDKLSTTVAACPALASTFFARSARSAALLDSVPKRTWICIAAAGSYHVSRPATEAEGAYPSRATSTAKAESCRASGSRVNSA